MSEKNDGPKKPFYQNIVDSKKRSRPERPGDDKKRASGDKRGSRGGSPAEAPSRGSAQRGGAASGSARAAGNRGFGPRDGGSARGPRDPSERGPLPRARARFDAPKKLATAFTPPTGETASLLAAFSDIVQSVSPLDSRRLHDLPAHIRELSHELTDERGDRRVGYLNDPAHLSAYVRYYSWWNLVRLTRLLPSLQIDLKDGDAAVDLGSGPLTLPLALWISRPDLRARKITWFCVDISQQALSLGEEIFLALAARTGEAPWEIVRVKGEFGVSLRRKVSFVASANMFNELYWDNPAPIEAQAKRHSEELASYAAPSASMLIVEPGVPRAGRFVSLLRDAFLRQGFRVDSPCPHDGVCPFPGLRNGKWCHFVFDPADAPDRLHRLSEDAHLSKDRAALSYVFASRTENARVEGSSSEDATALGTVGKLSRMFSDLRVRVVSDPIKLPEYYIGRYGCSELGMVLVCGTFQAADWLRNLESGSLIEVPRPDAKKAARDEKTGSVKIVV